MEDTGGSAMQDDGQDQRLEAIVSRLNSALLEVDHGEFFRARAAGVLANRADLVIEVPEAVLSLLPNPPGFDRQGDSVDASTLDAFLVAYHAAETLCRQVLAFIDGKPPNGPVLLTLSMMKAGPAFNNRLAEVMALTDDRLSAELDHLFIPQELQQDWPDEALSIASVQDYLRQWMKWLARFVTDWRNPYNAAKHGLAVGSKPAHVSFVKNGTSLAEGVTLMAGPTLRTLEHEKVTDSEGNPVKGPDGQRLVRWLWVYRAVDPDALIAQTFITAHLLDWLRDVATARHLNEGRYLQLRAEPKPLDLQRRTAPGSMLRVPLASVPLPPEHAERLWPQDDQE